MRERNRLYVEYMYIYPRIKGHTLKRVINFGNGILNDKLVAVDKSTSRNSVHEFIDYPSIEETIFFVHRIVDSYLFTF